MDKQTTTEKIYSILSSSTFEEWHKNEFEDHITGEDQYFGDDPDIKKRSFIESKEDILKDIGNLFASIVSDS